MNKKPTTLKNIIDDGFKEGLNEIEIFDKIISFLRDLNLVERMITQDDKCQMILKSYEEPFKKNILLNLRVLGISGEHYMKVIDNHENKNPSLENYIKATFLISEYFSDEISDVISILIKKTI